jgi:hypothetical protein
VQAPVIKIVPELEFEMTPPLVPAPKLAVTLPVMFTVAVLEFNTVQVALPAPAPPVMLPVMLRTPVPDTTIAWFA